MWSVAEALSEGEPTPSTLPTPSTPSTPPTPSTPSTPPPEKLQQQPATQPSRVWAVDPIAWFDYEDKDNAFKTPILAQDWTMLGQEVLKQIKSFGFTQTSYGGCLTKEYQAFLRVAIQSLESIGDELIPESSVKWEQLPPEFKSIAETLILDEVAQLSPENLGIFGHEGFINRELWAKGVSLGYSLIPSIPLSQNYFKIYRFFNEKKQHTSWNKISIDTENLHYDKIDQLVNKLIGDWWSGSKASDEVRELMLKLIITQNFEQSIQNTLIGASEFRTSYFNIVQKISDLPPAFLDWATQGTTFAHCKKALGDLGIPQIRRADGQKFANLNPIDVAKASYTFAYDTLDSVESNNHVGAPLSNAFGRGCFGGSDFSCSFSPFGFGDGNSEILTEQPLIGELGNVTPFNDIMINDLPAAPTKK